MAGMQAVTSSGSAEQIAVSSLMTYDLYGTYINPRASAKQLIAVSRTVVVLYGLVMGKRHKHDESQYRNNSEHGHSAMSVLWSPVLQAHQ